MGRFRYMKLQEFNWKDFDDGKIAILCHNKMWSDHFMDLYKQCEFEVIIPEETGCKFPGENCYLVYINKNGVKTLVCRPKYYCKNHGVRVIKWVEAIGFGRFFK